jgi:hypothetical protein
MIARRFKWSASPQRKWERERERGVVTVCQRAVERLMSWVRMGIKAERR